jgi:hypothetical protein
MLPLINALSTDPIDLTSATPSTSAFGLDNVDLQATFGDVMVSSMPDAESPLMTLADEILPAGGNSLPGNKPLVNMLPADTAPIDGIVLTTDEQNENGDLLAVTAPENELLIDAAESDGGETGPVIQGFLNPGTRRQVEDLAGSGRMRDRVQASLTPGNVRVFDGQSNNANGNSVVNQQADGAVRPVMPERPVANETIDAAKQTIDLAATTLRPVVEKFELSLKSTNVSAPQPSIVATDSVSQLQGASHVTRVTAPPAIQTGIDVPVLDDAWGDALNERVLWMAGKSIQKAEIRLNPADLGPIRVEISVTDDAAKVSFSAQNAMTREAIESALPRLREMLSENGLSLANTDVSDTGGQQEQNASEHDALHGPSAPTDGVVEDGVVGAESVLKSGQTSALVDTFV